MKKLLITLLMLPLLAFSQEAPEAQNNTQAELAKLHWQNGPTKGTIDNKATIAVPKGYVFLGAKDTSRFLEIMGNPPREKNYMLAPKDLEWFSIFTFDASGYVKDDEKIDASALLKSLKDGDESGNEERKQLVFRFNKIFT